MYVCIFVCEYVCAPVSLSLYIYILRGSVLHIFGYCIIEFTLVRLVPDQPFFFPQLLYFLHNHFSSVEHKSILFIHYLVMCTPIKSEKN